jgi:hypothetical protein
MPGLMTDQAEVRTATIKSTPVASHASPNQAPEKRGELENDAILGELAAAERRVPEINECVDRQRQLIGQLGCRGDDTTSAEIMLDSLLLSLFLAAEERHRLRAILNAKPD